MSNSSLVKRLQGKLQEESTSRQLQDELNSKLQTEYDQLLKRLAEAENHIDRLRLGANLELNRHFVVTHEHRYGDTSGGVGPMVPPHQPPHTLNNATHKTDTSAVGTDWDEIEGDSSLLIDLDDDLMQNHGSTGNFSSPLQYTLDVNTDQESVDHAHLPHPLYEDTPSFSDLSVTTIMDRASAESKQYAHLTKIKSLQGQISELQSKFNEGDSPFNDVLGALQDVQREHRQLSEDIGQSQEQLEALKKKYDGRVSQRISSSQLAIGYELSTLGDQLTDFVRLLQSKAESSSPSTSPTPSHLHTPSHRHTPAHRHTLQKTAESDWPTPHGTSATESALHDQLNTHWPRPLEEDEYSVVASELSCDSSPFLSSRYFPSTRNGDSHSQHGKLRDQYNQSHDPYDHSHDPYDKSHDPYDQSHDPYDQSHDPYDQSHDPYDQSHDRYNQSHDPYDLSHDRYSQSYDPYDLSHDQHVKRAHNAALDQYDQSHDQYKTPHNASLDPLRSSSHETVFPASSEDNYWPLTGDQLSVVNPPSSLHSCPNEDTYVISPTVTRREADRYPRVSVAPLPSGQLFNTTPSCTQPLRIPDQTTPDIQPSVMLPRVRRTNENDPTRQLDQHYSHPPSGTMDTRYPPLHSSGFVSTHSTGHASTASQSTGVVSTASRASQSTGHASTASQSTGVVSTASRASQSTGHASNASQSTGVVPSRASQSTGHVPTASQSTGVVPTASRASQSTDVASTASQSTGHASTASRASQSTGHVPTASQSTGVVSTASRASQSTGHASQSTGHASTASQSTGHAFTVSQCMPNYSQKQNSSSNHPRTSLVSSVNEPLPLYTPSHPHTSQQPTPAPSHPHTSQQPTPAPLHSDHNFPGSGHSVPTATTQSLTTSESGEFEVDRGGTEVPERENLEEQNQDFSALTVSAIDRLRKELSQLKGQIKASHPPHTLTSWSDQSDQASQEAHPHMIYASSSLPSHTSLTPSPTRRSIHTERRTTVELSSPEHLLYQSPLLTPTRTISTMATPQTTPLHKTSERMQRDAGVAIGDRAYSYHATPRGLLPTKNQEFEARSSIQFGDNMTPFKRSNFSEPSFESLTKPYEQAPDSLLHGQANTRPSHLSKPSIEHSKRPPTSQYRGDRLKEDKQIKQAPSCDSSTSRSVSGFERSSQGSSFDQPAHSTDEWSCGQCGGKGTSSISVSPGGTRTHTRSHKCTKVYTSPTHVHVGGKGGVYTSPTHVGGKGGVYTSPTHIGGKGGSTKHWRDGNKQVTPSAIIDHHHPSVTRDHHPSVTRDHHPSVTRDHHPSVSRDHHPSVTRGHTPSVTRDHHPSVSRDHHPSVTRGHTPSVTRDHHPSVTRYHTPSVTRGHTPSVTRDHHPSVTRDHTSSVTRDHHPSVARDHTPSSAVSNDFHLPCANIISGQEDSHPVNVEHNNDTREEEPSFARVATSTPTKPQQQTPHQESATLPKHSYHNDDSVPPPRRETPSQRVILKSPSLDFSSSYGSTQAGATLTTTRLLSRGTQTQRASAHPLPRDDTTIDTSPTHQYTHHSRPLHNTRSYHSAVATPISHTHYIPHSATRPSRDYSPTHIVHQMLGPSTVHSVTPNRPSRDYSPTHIVHQTLGPSTLHSVTPSRRDRIVYVSPRSPSDEEVYVSASTGRRRRKVRGHRRKVVVRPVQYVVRESDIDKPQEVEVLDLSEVGELARSLKIRSRKMHQSLKELAKLKNIRHF